MKRYWMAMLIGAAGCSSIPVTGDGIVTLELQTPRTLTVDPAETLTLHARALDQQGNPVESAAIRWYTVDTLAISLDSIAGVVQPLVAAGSARVQAGVGSLRSDPVTITIKATTP